MFFQHNSYRELLKESIESNKAIDKKFNRQKFALSIGVQKSYLSKVLNGGADLSFDQLYLAGNHFSWSREKKEFANLLLSYSRSGNEVRKKYLLEKIKECKSKNTKLSKHLKGEVEISERLKEYFLSPEIQLVFIGLSLKKYQRNISQLALDLAIAPSKFSSYLKKLAELDLIEFEKNKNVKVLVKNIHLPKSSEYYEIWHILLRQYMHSKSFDRSEYGYSFSALFSADDKTFTWLKSEIVKLLKKCQKQVGVATEKEIHYLNVDLNKVTEA